jgi:hypothetical protein
MRRCTRIFPADDADLNARRLTRKSAVCANLRILNLRLSAGSAFHGYAFSASNEVLECRNSPLYFTTQALGQ